MLQSICRTTTPSPNSGPGEIFGEMTCMSYYPRSATVRAKTDCVMLEMLRNVLDILQRNKTFRAQLERNYRVRALDSHLRSVPIFAPLTKDFVDHLRDRVELLRFSPGQVICRQGDPADSFYLIRIGFVKVSEEKLGGELCSPIWRGAAILARLRSLTGSPRNATCTALDHVEVVRISAKIFS